MNRAGALKHHDIACGNFRTHVVEAGKSGAPVLFLIHDGGLGGDAQTSWAHLIPELQSDFHLFAIDLYGFGRSDMVFEFGRRPYDSHIEQIANVVRHVGIKEAFFVGTSYGGSVLLRAAARDMLPWPMSGGVSIAGTGGVYRHESGKKMLAATEPNRDSLSKFVGLLVDPDWPGLSENVDQRLSNALRPGHWETLAAPRLRSPAGKPEALDDYPVSLSGCEVPLLLIEGRNDVLLEDQWASRVASNAPQGRAIELNCAHSPNLDRAPVIAGILRAFIGGASVNSE
jgi:pimeloyl-ACP methyl ester carboxylesterase